MGNSSMRKIVCGFLLIIFVGALLLSLPISSKSGQWTNFTDSLFTATSATCVTGLITFDTYSHWSLFGQITILTMIQIGGIGFMTIITLFSMFLGKKINIRERRLLMQSAGSLHIGGVVKLIKKIVIGTALFEGIGAIVLALRFCPVMGLYEGMYNAVFHSISAFCNAGFDLMGKYEAFSSLTHFKEDIIVNITVMILIITGGIGFIVWNDIYIHKFKFKNYQLHSKIVLITTLLLILVPAVSFFFLESNGEFKNLTFSQKITAAFFQSVTLRTAGFNTINLSSLSEGGNILSIFLMFVGGSPGSTAGGIKTTTLAVMLLSAVASTSQSESIYIFKRKISNDITRQAAAVITVYIAAILFSSILMCHIEPFSATDILFEVVSASGTVGLTKGITTLLSPVSKYIIIFLMFGGRVGGVTLMISIAKQKQDALISYPAEKILIG